MNDHIFTDYNWCPDCGEPRGVCRCEEMRAADAAIEEMDDGVLLYGDECPECGTYNTERQDVITLDPVVWTCQCGNCGATFERLINTTGDI